MIKTHTLKDLGDKDKDKGWACGATSGWVCLKTKQRFRRNIFNRTRYEK